GGSNAGADIGGLMIGVPRNGVGGSFSPNGSSGENFFSGAADFGNKGSAGQTLGNTTTPLPSRKGTVKSRTPVVRQQVRNAVQSTSPSNRKITTTGIRGTTVSNATQPKTINFGGAKGVTAKVDPDPAASVTTGDGADGGIAAGTTIT